QVEPSTEGAGVVDVATDSPAGDAGLEPGDVIVELNRRAGATAADYKNAGKSVKKGDTALVRVRRGQATQYGPGRVEEGGVPDGGRRRLPAAPAGGPAA